MRRLIWIGLVVSVLVACGGGAKAATGDDVVAAFKAANLEAEGARPMAKDDYGAAPYVCTGTRFLIPSLGEEAGGRVFVCGNDADRDALATFYTELGKGSALLFSWVFVKDRIVVQINGDLPEEQARKYEAALNGMK